MLCLKKLFGYKFLVKESKLIVLVSLQCKNLYIVFYGWMIRNKKDLRVIDKLRNSKKNINLFTITEKRGN